MASYRTGRNPTLTWTGTWNGFSAGSAGIAPIEGPPGVCHRGTGVLGWSARFQIRLQLPFGDGTGFLYAEPYDSFSGYYGVQLYMADGHGNSDDDYERIILPDPKTWTYPWSGAIDIEADCWEYVKTDVPLPPDWVDGDGFLIEPYDTYKFGVLAYGYRIYLVAKEIRISAAANGASVSTTATGLSEELWSYGLPVIGGDYGWEVYSRCSNIDAECGFSLTYNGQCPSVSRDYSRTNSHTVAESHMDTANVWARVKTDLTVYTDGCDAAISENGWGTGVGFWEPPRSVKVLGKALNVGGGDGSLTVGWISHAAAALEVPSYFGLSPTGSDRYDQLTWGADSSVNDFDQTSVAEDGRAAARAWVESQPGEDSRDCTLPFLMDPYPALEISQDASVVVAGDKTLTHTDTVIPL